jgi:hypothetical protein
MSMMYPQNTVAAEISKYMGNAVSLSNIWGNLIINVKASPYLAKGDGITDDTASIQSALNAINNGTLIFPPGTYKVGNLVIQNKTNVKIIGYGATLQLQGTASSGNNIGLQLVGTIDTVTIEGLTIIGSGVVGDAHAGIYSNSGQTLKNVRTLYNTIKNVIIGITYNADTGGNIDGGIIEGNNIVNIVGTNPGQGYGIHHSNGNGTPSNLLIIGNRIDQAQRHSIYQARGSAVIIADNRISNHRQSIATGDVRPAINISRSQNITVQGNIVENFYDSAFYIDVDTNAPCSNIVVNGNQFINPKNAVIPVWIGYLQTISSVFNEEIIFTNNLVYINAINISCMDVSYGKRILIKNNIFTLLNNTASINALTFDALNESGGSTNYSDYWEISENMIYSNSTNVFSAFRFNTGFISGGVNAQFRNNRVIGTTTTFDQSATISNPNITVTGQPTNGLSFTGGVTMKPNLLNGPTQTTIGSAGSAAALPSAPVGYLQTTINGTLYAIPYYNH